MAQNFYSVERMVDNFTDKKLRIGSWGLLSKKNENYTFTNVIFTRNKFKWGRRLHSG